MKALYNKHKKEIWIGVIVSIITAAILKFGEWLIEVVPIAGLSIFEVFSNVLYSSAATHSDSLMWKILLLSSVSIMAGMLWNSIKESLQIYKDVLYLEKESKKFSDEELNTIKEKVLTNLESKKNNNDITQKSIPEVIAYGKTIGKSAISVILVIALTYFLVIFFITTPISLSNKFEQDITKIAPYVEESEIIQLKSDWLCMRSKSDYDDIYERINIVKEEHELP